MRPTRRSKTCDVVELSMCFLFKSVIQSAGETFASFVKRAKDLFADYQITGACRRSSEVLRKPLRGSARAKNERRTCREVLL